MEMKNQRGNFFKVMTSDLINIDVVHGKLGRRGNREEINFYS